MKDWTISDFANIGRSFPRSWTLRQAYAEAVARSNGSMKIKIDRKNHTVCFRGGVFL